MTLILRLLFNALGLTLIAYLIDGIYIDGFYPALIAAIVLGIMNIVIRPILLVLTLPITIITLGLFAFVINAALFLFAASFIEGFAVDSFWYALAGSILMSVVSTIGNNWINSEPPKSTVKYREIK
ncbi:phage holin family protein [Candidatus Kaiserbacteria bacterium]|nr:phage holin family protein [Candidatus Kaiserbacteria bacterium]